MKDLCIFIILLIGIGSIYIFVDKWQHSFYFLFIFPAMLVTVPAYNWWKEYLTKDKSAPKKK